MIPRKLTLKNFLSYREANLDFNGLHTACICGANGAGKSSLLEAITWAMWGKSRMESEDDVIYGGEKNVRVDFEFISNGLTYRVIRSRQRGKTASLDFQVLGELGFRSLTGRGIKNTQEEIISAIKLDYDTFVNSAYLRQGKADEFMLCNAGKRKQILADLLKLSRYEQLSEQAKNLARDYQIQTQQLEKSLEPIAERCEIKPQTELELKNLQQQLNQLQKNQTMYFSRLENLQLIDNQRQTWEKQYEWQKKQSQDIQQECNRLTQEIATYELELQNLGDKFLKREVEINQNFQNLLELQKQEEIFAAKSQTHQEYQQQKQELEKLIEKQKNQLQLKLQEAQTNLQYLKKQEKENQEIIGQKEQIEAGLLELNQYRERLTTLDNLQTVFAPLQQRERELLIDLERVKQRYQAQLEQLQKESKFLSKQLEQVPQKRKEYLEVSAKKQELEKKRVFSDRLQEKGTDKKSLKQRLEEKQKQCEKQLEETKQKLALLQTHDATCPLCQQELFGEYRQLVLSKSQDQYNTLEAEVWNIAEEIRVNEYELEQLRVEFSLLKQELKNYDSLNNQLGQLEAQLEATDDMRIKLEEITTQLENINKVLNSNKYAEDIQEELNTIQTEIKKLNYDEKTHHLVREQVKAKSKIEIQHAALEQAQRRQQDLDKQIPLILEKIKSLTEELQQLSINSPTQKQLEEIDETIKELGYERSLHNQILVNLRESQSYAVIHQQLLQAQKTAPEINLKIQEREDKLEKRTLEKALSDKQVEALLSQKEQIEDNREDIQILKNTLQEQQQQINELLSQKGRLEQLLLEIANLEKQYEQNKQELEKNKKQLKIYQELAQAFGKNGLQTLMIENILPYLEAETNQILARLTGNQLHVQFITQKAAKSNSAKNKMLDTLDIHIADNKGTRPYESYSGGEAFRINFAIRLALARLLAQRSGASLQMLIIDEGFGTQDDHGCELLVAAINTIASDFACILTVTHMPQFKEAFQNRIEVRKTNEGSKISFSA